MTQTSSDMEIVLDTRIHQINSIKIHKKTWTPYKTNKCNKFLPQFLMPILENFHRMFAHILKIYTWLYGFITDKQKFTFSIFWNFVIFRKHFQGLSCSWLYGSWIYNYLCNQCLSPLKLWVWILPRLDVLDTTLCDKDCQ